MDDIRAIQVNIWGQFVGAVAPLRNKPGYYEFSYAPEFEKGHLELSPILMKMKARRRFSFPRWPRKPFTACRACLLIHCPTNSAMR